MLGNTIQPTTLYRWILLFLFYRWEDERRARPYSRWGAELGSEPWQSNSQSNLSTTVLHNLTRPARNPESPSLCPSSRSFVGSQRIPVFLTVTSCPDFLLLLNFFSPWYSFLHFFLIFHPIFIRVIHPHSLKNQIQDFFRKWKPPMVPHLFTLHVSHLRWICFHLIYCLILLLTSLSQNTMSLWLPLDFSILGILHSFLTMEDTYSYCYLRCPVVQAPTLWFWLDEYSLFTCWLCKCSHRCHT